MSSKNHALWICLVVFPFVYIAQLFLLGIFVQKFGINLGSTSNVFAILGSITIISIIFSRVNHRVFAWFEYVIVVTFCIIFDILIQIGFTIWLIGPSSLNGKWFGIVAILILHGAMFSVGFLPFFVKRYLPSSA